MILETNDRVLVHLSSGPKTGTIKTLTPNSFTPLSVLMDDSNAIRLCRAAEVEKMPKQKPLTKARELRQMAEDAITKLHKESDRAAAADIISTCTSYAIEGGTHATFNGITIRPAVKLLLEEYGYTVQLFDHSSEVYW